MQETQQAGPQRKRLTAEEVRNKYGAAAIFLLAWEIWCIYDGWFHPQYEYIGFSRFMAYISAPVLAFCVVMAGSALRAIQRQKASADRTEGGNPPETTL
jgi:hypothetical protein